MRSLQNQLTLDNLAKAESLLVPHILTKNYFNILKLKLENKPLTSNQRYYYNHYIKKKLLAMMELFDISEYNINGKEFIKPNRLKKAITLLKKYSRKHKNKKILIAGSFLYGNSYKDIDVFIISKYDKEDHIENKVHVNYLPENIEHTLFFKSISQISISNFKYNTPPPEEDDISDILSLYEMVILLAIQNFDYKQELRDFLVKIEYFSEKVILNSMQLKIISENILKNKDPIRIINRYLVIKLINSKKASKIKKVLKRFIEINSKPEKGMKMPKNWIMYNKTFKEALEIVT